MVSKAKIPKKKGVENKKKLAKKPKITVKKAVEEPKKLLNKPITEHVLVPKHRLMSDEEKQELLKKYGIGLNQLPKISSDDPVVNTIKDFKPGDVLEIKRNSETAGTTKYYRVIRND